MSLTGPQVEARMHGIGGSDAAAALGIDPYRSALALYLEKTTERPPSTLLFETPAMVWGTLLEPVIRQRYSDLTGRVVRQYPTLHHPKYKFMLGHVDGVTDDNRLFEAKTARVDEGWGAPGTDEVPENYIVQVQHYLAITNLPVADVAVLIGASDFRMYQVESDPEFQELLIDGESTFWERVEQRHPPDPDWARAPAPLIAKLYPGTDGKALTATEEQHYWYWVYRAAQAKGVAYNATVDAAKAHLLWEMGDAATLLFNDGQQLRRKRIKRKGYEVAPMELIDARFVKAQGEQQDV